MRGREKILADERGIILVISLLIMALLAAVGVGAIVSVRTDLRTSGNLKTGTQAFYIADAGVSHAHQQMQYGTVDFDSVLMAADGTQIVSNSFNGGTYRVTRAGSTSDPSRVKLVSTGVAPNNARALIEVWFKKDAGRPSKAVESNGDLRIRGNPIILGTCGGAHANEEISIEGSPGIQMEGGFTASNQTTTKRRLDIGNGMIISGSPCVGSPDCASPPDSRPEDNKLDTAPKRAKYVAAHNSAPLRRVPKINPAEYASLVAAMGSDRNHNHYILHANGTVTTGGACRPDGLCSGGTNADVPNGWEFSLGTWKVKGDGATNGIFYSEGRVEISGSPGSSSSPWLATIIARDSINVSGNPHIRPYPESSEKLMAHLFVTGNDLEISGNMAAHYSASATLVHQQFRISGNPYIRGFIIAGDGLPSWSEDPFPPLASDSGVALNEISGHPTIRYSCEFGCSSPGCPPPSITRISWVQKF
jgi:hypothetical protein